MTTKTVFFLTNLNNKLHNEAMVHLDLAPWSDVSESVLANTIVEIRTKDNSYPPSRWQVNDLYRAPFGKMTSLITWPSHGMDQADCYSYLKAIHPDINTDTPMAVYYYKKISE